MATRVKHDEARSATIDVTDQGRLFRGAVEVDPEQGRAALKRTAADLVRLIREMQKPSERPPRLEWTSVEVAVHLLQTFRNDIGYVEGTVTPYPVFDGKVLASGAKQSARKIAEEPERDPRNSPSCSARRSTSFSIAPRNATHFSRCRSPKAMR